MNDNERLNDNERYEDLDFDDELFRDAGIANADADYDALAENAATGGDDKSCSTFHDEPSSPFDTEDDSDDGWDWGDVSDSDSDEEDDDDDQ